MSITTKLFSVFSSLLVTTAVLFFDSPVAMACSPNTPVGSGVSHGSTIYSGSVTVCVGVQVTTSQPPVTSPTPPKPGGGIILKPVTRPTVCPSAEQKKLMPKSPDAAERWIKSICASSVKPPIVSKPAIPTPPRPVTLTPVSTTYNSAAVSFSPNSLRAKVHPSANLNAGEVAVFSANPSLHYRKQQVLGRQAEVLFTPAWLGWQFSDGPRIQGIDVDRAFETAGKYEAWAIANYFVSYRILGESAWRAVPGQISVLSNVIKIEVKVSPVVTPSADPKLLLVGEDCSSNARGWGCDS
jgi:hypothetical protein